MIPTFEEFKKNLEYAYITPADARRHLMYKLMSAEDTFTRTLTWQKNGLIVSAYGRNAPCRVYIATRTSFYMCQEQISDEDIHLCFKNGGIKSAAVSINLLEK